MLIRCRTIQIFMKRHRVLVTVAALCLLLPALLLLESFVSLFSPFAARQPPDDRDPSAPSSICHSPACIAAYESRPGQRERIPRIRHILWKDSRVSRYFANQLKTWGDIHPNWTFVLWRDADLDVFVAKHYPSVLSKFRSLPHFIMRIDMIRYIILHKFGGVYADLDYILVRPLDRFLKFPAVVTRETEAHAMLHFGMRHWPPPLLANPAFLMSEPSHPFYNFCVSQLSRRPAVNYMEFAGPLGLTDLLVGFTDAFPVAVCPATAVYVPASYSFYSYRNNSLATSTSEHQPGIQRTLRFYCRSLFRAASANLTAYCSDVLTLDPVTDKRELSYAVHDNMKARSSYDSKGSRAFTHDLVDIRSVLPTVVMADTIY